MAITRRIYAYGDLSGKGVVSTSAASVTVSVTFTFASKSYSSSTTQYFTIYVCSDTTASATTYTAITSWKQNWTMTGYKTTLTFSKTFTSDLIGKDIQKIVVLCTGHSGTTASHDCTGLSSSSGSITVKYSKITIGAPTNLQINGSSTAVTTSLGGTAKLSWAAGSKGRKTDGTTVSATSYKISYKDQNNTTKTLTATTTSCTITASQTHNKTYSYTVQAIYSSDTSFNSVASTSSPNFTSSQPIIQTKPVINALTTTKGSTIAVTCSTAAFKYTLTGYHIDYYWYCTKSNVYASNLTSFNSDTSTSYTFKQNDFVSNGAIGDSEDGTPMYLYVKAVYTNGTKSYSYTPTYDRTFNYFPTINKPKNFSITPSAGDSTILTWANELNGAGEQCKTVLYIDGYIVKNGDDISDSNTGLILDNSFWNKYSDGDHDIQIAHQWYGVQARSTKLIFTYSGGSYIYYYINGKWEKCEIYYYDSSQSGTSKWVKCIPYYYTNNIWQKC